ncbi:MAG: hypothetical protein QXG39_00115 [Candidatus Aenigmatarchaeota archaeon]
MPVEIKGQQLRVSFYTKGYQYQNYKNFRVHDVGRKGYLQRLTGQNKITKDWVTLGWRWNLSHYKNWEGLESSIYWTLVKAPVEWRGELIRKAITLARRWWKKHKKKR